MTSEKSSEFIIASITIRKLFKGVK